MKTLISLFIVFAAATVQADEFVCTYDNIIGNTDQITVNYQTGHFTGLKFIQFDRCVFDAPNEKTTCTPHTTFDQDRNSLIPLMGRWPFGTFVSSKKDQSIVVNISKKRGNSLAGSVVVFLDSPKPLIHELVCELK